MSLVGHFRLKKGQHQVSPCRLLPKGEVKSRYWHLPMGGLQQPFVTLIATKRSPAALAVATVLASNISNDSSGACFSMAPALPPTRALGVPLLKNSMMRTTIKSFSE
jgi:hypothetical protein